MIWYFELYNSQRERMPCCCLQFVYTFMPSKCFSVSCSGFSQGQAESGLVLQNKELT